MKGQIMHSAREKRGKERKREREKGRVGEGKKGRRAKRFINLVN